MSSDNGYVIQVDDEGNYVLQMYFASGDGLPNPATAKEKFPTLEGAVRRYAALDSGEDASEFGLSVNLSNEKDRGNMETTKYRRKPLYVDVVQVTNENMVDVARWADGEVREDSEQPGGPIKYVYIRVHHALNERQTKAYVGDWVLYGGTGYKVYTNKAFLSSFEVVKETRNVFDEEKAAS